MPDIGLRADLLVQRGQVAEAYGLLCAGEAAGSAEAAVTLADWRMSGAVIRRDLAEARRLYGRAAELGCDDAEPVFIALLANGAGGSGRRWSEALSLLARRVASDPQAAAQMALIKAMSLDADGEPLGGFARKQLSQVAHIERIANFLSEEECRCLSSMAAPSLAPSVIVDPKTGQQRLDPVRTGWSTSFPFVFENPVLHAINRRIAAVTSTSWVQGEPVQVLRYEAGQEYRLHSDALPNGGNQRVLTLLVALNDDYDGGETEFPRLGQSVRLRTGEALLFSNVDASGQPDVRMWHAGKQVLSGRKLLLSKWIRANALDLSGPPDRPF